MPCFYKISCSFLATYKSIVEQISSIHSIIVTYVPSLLYTDPSYTPMYPPPIITKLLGIFFNYNAPVELKTTFSSKDKEGNYTGWLPVAITIFFALISCD